MPTSEELFQSRLRATFRVEAQDHIQTIASGLIQMERMKGEIPGETVDPIFRATHSLKGAARTVGVTTIEAVCQSVESAFDAMKRGTLSASSDLFDVLHQAVTLLDQLSQRAESDAVPEGLLASISALHDSVSHVLLTQSKLPAPRQIHPVSAVSEASISPPVESAASVDTVRLPAARLDALLLQTEEMLSVKLSAQQHAGGLRQLRLQTVELKKKVTPELSDMLELVHSEIGRLEKSAVQHQRSVGSMVDGLLDEMKNLVMLPFSTLTDVFPRFVREFSRDHGKDVDLIVRGGEIAMDRRVLEGIKDSLTHLVRNCLDHGMEPPAERTRTGKPARGTIAIELSTVDGSQVELSVTDDGPGIDRLRVKEAASALGVLAQAKRESLSDEESLALIFESGVSTSPTVTDISGRGLGLAIVREAVQRIDGSLSLESEPGKGSTVRIRLPMTLARFRGVLLRVEERLFVVSTSSVQRATRVRREDIRTVENRETLTVDGEILSLVRLGRLLNLPTKMAEDPSKEHSRSAVIVGRGNRRIAFLVDEILDEREVLVKTLGRQLQRVRNIAGATILGSGQVVPILHAPDLVDSAMSWNDTVIDEPATGHEVAKERQKSVLVAEDSITSRTLLKSILETAGYRVTTAVDGIDAFTKLRSGDFDLVVSDVDMPRMNGFGLTSKIRADKKLSEVPVILVTALSSPSDREHGIDVGASAYIVKSSFDQGNLLEVIRRWI